MKRHNPGRKKLPDNQKKKAFILYLSKEEILKAGGEKMAKEKALNAILS